MIQERKSCRMCGSRRLEPILDLGRTALANDFITAAEVAGYRTFLPLRLRLCRDCSLAQLADVVDPGVLYSRYAYVTSTSRTMDAHLAAQARHVAAAAGGAPRKVLEIASNTGVYLQKFKAMGSAVLGVEPARNIAELAEEAGIPTWIDFFGARSARQIREQWGRPDVILGRHVFAHIDDLRDLMEGLETLAHERTLIGFEVPYLVDMLQHTEFDTIYHEHLSYVPLRAVQALLANTPFALERVEHYPIHGGSILFQFRRREAGVAPHPGVAAALAREAELRLAEPQTWNGFVERVGTIRRDLPRLIAGLKAKGKRVIGYGASAKGNTLLNTSGLGAGDLDYIIDNTPFKQGKVAPGSWIPVRAPQALLEDQPDYALLLAWNFAPEIIGREQEYQKRGGRFIVPIPEPRIVEFAGR
ncbi:MAG: class I SAM-dependent methyltransferase [Betaproteobacteria bacterium]